MVVLGFEPPRNSYLTEAERFPEVRGVRPSSTDSMRLSGPWVFLLLLPCQEAFFPATLERYRRALPLSYFPLDVDKICEEKLSFDRDRFQFSLVEEKDLHEVAELSMMSFYSARIKLNTEGMVGLEKAIWYSLE